MEHSPDQNEGTKETVLAKIRAKRVSMRPKLYFTAEAVLAGFVALVILIVSIAIVSFILFGLRVNGHESLLSFGPRGVLDFLFLFPWPLVILDALLVIFLETLLRRFKFGYSSPMLYLLLVLFAIAIAAGLALDRGTSVNDQLEDRAEHGGLPAPFDEIYEHARVAAPHDRGIYRGTITQLGTSTLRLAHEDLDVATDTIDYFVTLPPGFDTSLLTVGERIYVAGDMASGTIRAFGVHALPPPPR